METWEPADANHDVLGTACLRCGQIADTALRWPCPESPRERFRGDLRKRDDWNRFMGEANAMEKVLDPKGPIWNRMHGDGWDEGFAEGAHGNPYAFDNPAMTNPYRSGHQAETPQEL